MCQRFFFSSRRRHTRWPRDWSSDVCSSDLLTGAHGSLTELSALVAGAAPGASSARAAADVALHDAWARDAELALVELLRSEERRVGKECRAGWVPDDLQEEEDEERV